MQLRRREEAESASAAAAATAAGAQALLSDCVRELQSQLAAQEAVAADGRRQAVQKVEEAAKAAAQQAAQQLFEARAQVRKASDAGHQDRWRALCRSRQTEIWVWPTCVVSSAVTASVLGRQQRGEFSSPCLPCRTLAAHRDCTEQAM